MRPTTALRAALALAALLAAGTPAADAATAATTETSRHCVVRLAETGTPAAASPTQAPVRCFGTLTELSAHLDTTVVANPLIDDLERMLREFYGGHPIPPQVWQVIEAYENAVHSKTESVVGVGKDVDYIDETYTFVVDGTTGCTTGKSYDWRAMPNGWNDKIESLETFAGCSATVYEHEDFKGASQTCTCATLGVLEDEVSSIKFYRI